MASQSKITFEHKEIRRWAEERNGKPATIAGTGGKNDAGLLRINFPGRKEDKLEEISWDEFFEKFEEKELAFLYQDKTAAGNVSRFGRFISRETAQSKSVGKEKTSSHKSTGRSKTAADKKPAPKAQAKGKTKSKAKSKS